MYAIYSFNLKTMKTEITNARSFMQADHFFNVISDMAEESTGVFLVNAENGEILRTCHVEVDEDDGDEEEDWEDPWDDEVGFNPYEGCYDYDC